VKGRLVPREDLRRDDRAAMRLLLEAHFEGVTPAVFERDLAQKQWVLLIEEAGCLRGFSTLLLYPARHEDEDFTVVYSGDTIMDRRARSSSALSRCWIGSVRALRRLEPGRRLYWLLLVSGFRTYRFLPLFWREFHPRFDVAPPARVKRRLDFLAAERLGRCYSPETGVARLETPQQLRSELRELPASQRGDPHVAFFLARNPGWERGDELVCLTEIADDNLTAAGWRMWRAGERTLEIPAMLA
jgi:hypothetical protein